MRSSIVLALYTLVNLYFAVFNWRVFTARLNIDLGFAVLEIPPFVTLFLAGFVLIGILSWINYNIRLRKMILDLEQGVEIGKLKNRLVDRQFRDLLYDGKTLTVLKDRLGIQDLQSNLQDLQSKNKDIVRLISELSREPLKSKT